MKKTLIALMALGGVAFGDTTLFTNLDATTTIDGITYTPGVELAGLPFTDGISVGSFTTSAEGGFEGSYGGKPAITIAFTLNLTQALATETQVDLIGISGNSGDVGLTLLGDGKAQGKWNAGTHGNARLTLSDLSAYTYVIGDESFVTLTLTASKPDTNGGRGVQVYVNDGTCVFNHSSLATNNNDSFDGITVNTGLISSVSITAGLPEFVNAGAASPTTGAIGAALQAAVIPAPSIPEPATATLSLLALAGLAARRRRK